MGENKVVNQMVAEGEGGAGSSGVGDGGGRASDEELVRYLRLERDKDSGSISKTLEATWLKVYHTWLHNQTGAEGRKGCASFTAGNY